MLVDGKSVDKRIASREDYVYSYTQVFNLKLEDYKQAKTISFTVVDNAGNEFSRPLSKILGNTTISNSLLMLEDSLPTAELEVISNDHTTADGRLLFNVDAGYKIDLRDEDAGIRRAELWLVDDFDNEFSLGNYAVSIEGKVSSSGFTSSMDGFSGEITGDSFAALELNGSVSIASHPDFDNLRLKLEVEDMAGNKEGFMGAGFATDSTKPVISSVSYDNNSATNGNYYASSRTASITINEHNFDPAGVLIQGNASQASFPAISTWSQSGDVWTASLSFTEDGVYSYTIKVTDRAGNESELFTQEEFVIDKTAPTASISGIAHNSASNSEDAIVFYVTADDTNIDSLVLSFNVSFMSEGEIIERSYSLAELEAAFGVTSYTSVSSASQLQYTISIPNDSALFNDGIYFMSVSVADKAGNSTNSVSCTTEDGSSTQLSGSPFSFSVNRHGSTYRVLWEDGSSVAENNAKTYETAQNIVIEEINVDEVDRTAAGSYISLSDGTESRSIDSAIDGQKNTVELRSNYSIYSYTVEKENFSLSRLYTLEIASADNSGNTSDGQSKNICRQSFVIDNDAPVISLNVDDNSQYQVSVKTIEIAVSDITACEVELYIGKVENRQQPEGIKLNGEAVEGKVIKLPAGNNKLSFEYSRTISELQVIAKDSVGHTAKVEKHNITISDNALIVQFVGFYTNNTVLFYVIIAALLAAIFAVIFFVARKRRKGK